jgi:hypothetical protein
MKATSCVSAPQIVVRPICATFCRHLSYALIAASMLWFPVWEARADDPAPAQPIFKPGAGAIVTGLSGLVAGTKEALTLDRSKDRINTIRRELTNQLLTMRDTQTELSLGGLAPGSAGADYMLSNQIVLCNSRGDHAVVAADANYINTVTSALNRFATPPKIGTIGDALGNLFQHYSIEAPKGRTKKETAKAVLDRCNNDVAIWASFSYGRTLEKAPPTESATAELAIEDLSAVGSAVSTLYSAIVAILQPIVVGTAKAIDAQARANTISDFITTDRQNLINAAQNLADKGGRFARKNRLDALGQFAEKMAVLRSIKIDLSKAPNCKSVVQSPILPLPQGASATPNRVPTDDFIMCYAAAWKQIADAVQDVLTAANQYDAFADASDDQLQQAVQQIKTNIVQLENPSPVQVKDLWEAAAQLIAFGETVSQSLSKDNLDKANKAIADLMKIFNSK